MPLQPKVCLQAITLGNLSPAEHYSAEQHISGTGARLPPWRAQDRLDSTAEQLRAATVMNSSVSTQSNFSMRYQTGLVSCAMCWGWVTLQRSQRLLHC